LSFKSKSTDLIQEHYQRPEIKSKILEFCDSRRALNGDMIKWYHYEDNSIRRLLNPDTDYDEIISKHRTLYATLDLFDKEIFNKKQEYESSIDKKNVSRDGSVLGTLEDCEAYSLGIDIDTMDTEEGDITKSKRLQLGIENAISFLLKKFKNIGVEKSIHILYSGGGAYFIIHHELFKAPEHLTGNERAGIFKKVHATFNMFITDLLKEFQQIYPQYDGMIKFDALNNQKRVFKTIYSIHKRLNLAVIPLDKSDLHLDISKAKLPISDEIIELGKSWYKDYDYSESEALVKALIIYDKIAKIKLEKMNTKYDNRNKKKEFRSYNKIKPTEFCPWLMALLNRARSTSAGKTRVIAGIATMLPHAGYSDEESIRITMDMANDAGLGERIDLVTDHVYNINAPSCHKIQSVGSHYPNLGYGDLDCKCVPNETCAKRKCEFPFHYWMEGREDKVTAAQHNEPKAKSIKSKHILPDDIENIRLYKDTQINQSGVDDTDGKTYIKKLSKKITKDGENNKEEQIFLLDGYLRIASQTWSNENSTLNLCGKGSDGKVIKFDLPASDAADPRKWKAIISSKFGARCVVGELEYIHIQRISKNVIDLTLIDSPKWLNGKIAVPGLGLQDNLKFDLISKVPADVSTGDLKLAQECLINLMEAWDPSKVTLLLVTILGAPLIARWFPGDRFGLVIRATSGFGKTEAVKTMMGIYGTGYLNESNILKWGEGGSVGALLKVATKAGCFAWLVDNYKPMRIGSSQHLITLLHSVLEGGEKIRLSRNADLKESQDFNCIPIITGEDFVEEASSLARVILIDWTPVEDAHALTNAQKLSLNLPAIGKSWLTWLSENGDFVDSLKNDFDEDRDKCKNALFEAGCINPSRIGTSVAILKIIWKSMLQCPDLGHILSKYNVNFKNGLIRVLEVLSEETSYSTEAERFVSTLQQAITSGKVRLAPKGEIVAPDNDHRTTIGWIDDGREEVCIFPDIAKDVCRRIGGISDQELTATTLHKQLANMDYITTSDGRNTITRRHGKSVARVLVFKLNKLLGDKSIQEQGDTKQTSLDEISSESSFRKAIACTLAEIVEF
jgi:hypothetical protein